MKLGTHVAGGLVIAGGIAALAAGGVLLLGAAAATAIKIGMTVFLAGSLYVGEQALSDIRSGRVSDLDQYTRKAVAGSVVGFLTGASGLFLTGASLGRVLALGFGEGLVGSIVTQKLLNEDGEIDWGVAIAEAGFSAVTAGLAWKGKRSVKGVGGGGEALEGGTSTLAQYGDDFGKMGTYVENPNIKVDWTQYAEHGAERMQQRGMTQEMVNNIVENGKVLSQNNGNKFAYITQEGVAIVSKEGKLITAWSSTDFDSSMLEIISKLFGE